MSIACDEGVAAQSSIVIRVSSEECSDSVQDGPDDDSACESLSSDEFASFDAEDDDRDAIPVTCELDGVVNEIITTEENYVCKLSLLIQAKTAVTDVLNDAAVGIEMFPGIEALFGLHNENILVQLYRQAHTWPQEKVVGKIFSEHARVFQVYHDYFRGFEKAGECMDKWTSRSDEVKNELDRVANELKLPQKSASSSKDFLKLDMKSYLLEPMQRICRYPLLLRSYVKALSEDEEDYDRAKQAIDMIEEVTSRMNETVRNENKLLEYAELILMPPRQYLMTPGRIFLKEGDMKLLVSQSSEQLQRRAFMFSDIFLLCSSCGPFSSKKFEVTDQMSLKRIKASQSYDEQSFHLRNPEKELCLSTDSAEDNQAWVQIINASHRKLKERHESVRLIAPPKFLRHQCSISDVSDELGQSAPHMVRFDDVTRCMRCEKSLGNRHKHHCYACGAVICKTCGRTSLPLPYRNGEKKRVCHECKKLLKKTGPPSPQPSFHRNKPHSTCLQKGYVRVSFARGQERNRYWLELYENGSLEFYKAVMDTRIDKSWKLGDCWTEIQTLNDKTLLEVMNKKTYLCLELDNNKQEMLRWTETIEGVIRDSEDTHPQEKTTSHEDEKTTSHEDEKTTSHEDEKTPSHEDEKTTSHENEKNTPFNHDNMLKELAALSQET